MKNSKAYVVGSDVKESLSPLIFNYWFDKYNINAEYQIKEIKTEFFDDKIKKLLGEDGLCGLNITIPFKERIIKHLNETDEHSTKIGAVNCVCISKSKLIGINTDWSGFGNAIKEKRIDKENKNNKIIIIGFGGAAKGILYYFLKERHKEIHIFNRTHNKIKNIKTDGIYPHPLKELGQHIETAHTIVNTAPTDVLGEINVGKLKNHTNVIDIVYNPKETNFLKHFIRPKNKIYGISMLIHQAVPCFEQWFGFRPPIDEELLTKINKKL